MLLAVLDRMGNHLAKKGSSVPVGNGANLSKLASGIRVNVLDQLKGPFDKSSGETALCTDFWENQRTVVHLLRRFG